MIDIAIKLTCTADWYYYWVNMCSWYILLLNWRAQSITFDIDSWKLFGVDSWKWIGVDNWSELVWTVGSELVWIFGSELVWTVGSELVCIVGNYFYVFWCKHFCTPNLNFISRLHDSAHMHVVQLIMPIWFFWRICKNSDMKND